MKKLLIVLTMLGLSGCGTVATNGLYVLHPSCDKNAFSLIYSGTKLDAHLIGQSFKRDTTHRRTKAGYSIAGAVDLPFSLAFDTILLPYTVTEHFTRKKRCA